MITAYHEIWVFTLGISFPKNWQKNIFFSVGKKSFLGGMSKWLQLLHKGGTAKWLQYYSRGGGGGGMPKWLQYYIGGEGSLPTPKSDYVICARPLTVVSWCSAPYCALNKCNNSCHPVFIQVTSTTLVCYMYFGSLPLASKWCAHWFWGCSVAIATTSGPGHATAWVGGAHRHAWYLSIQRHHRII